MTDDFLYLTLKASDIFVVFRVKIKCIIFNNPRTPPGGVKTL
jgi:hypothetical protein